MHLCSTTQQRNADSASLTLAQSAVSGLLFYPCTGQKPKRLEKKNMRVNGQGAEGESGGRGTSWASCRSPTGMGSQGTHCRAAFAGLGYTK